MPAGSVERRRRVCRMTKALQAAVPRLWFLATSKRVTSPRNTIGVGRKRFGRGSGPAGACVDTRPAGAERVALRREAGLSRKGIRHLAKLDLGRDGGRDRGAGARASDTGRSNPATMSRSSAATARRSTGRWWRRRWRARVPVPLYQDAVADEIAYVLDHCGARFVVAGDQEQVDKVLEVQDSAASLEHIVYLDPRGLRKYDHAAHDVLRRRAGGGTRRARTGWRRAGARARAALDARRHLRDALHLRHHRAAQGRGAVEPQHHRDGEELRRVRPSDRATRRCWPICRWPGSAISSFRSVRPSGAGSASTAPRAPRRCTRTCARSGRPISSRRRAYFEDAADHP